MMGRGWSLQVPHQSCKVMPWRGELLRNWGPQLFSFTVVFPKYSEQHPAP